MVTVHNQNYVLIISFKGFRQFLNEQIHLINLIDIVLILPFDIFIRRIAFDLKSLGYKTHAVHNHRALFYNRNDVFANIGFNEQIHLINLIDIVLILPFDIFIRRIRDLDFCWGMICTMEKAIFTAEKIRLKGPK